MLCRTMAFSNHRLVMKPQGLTFLLVTNIRFHIYNQKSTWQAGVTSTGVKKFEKGDTLLMIAGAKYAR
jgi:hypothetical protein